MRDVISDTFAIQLEIPRYLSALGRKRRISSLLASEFPESDNRPIFLIPGTFGSPGDLVHAEELITRLGNFTNITRAGIDFNIGDLMPHVESMISQLEELKAKNKGQKASIIGWSSGGTIGLYAAFLRPDLVETVVGLEAPMAHDLYHDDFNIWMVPVNDLVTNAYAAQLRRGTYPIKLFSGHSGNDGIVSKRATQRPDATDFSLPDVGHLAQYADPEGIIAACKVLREV